MLTRRARSWEKASLEWLSERDTKRCVLHSLRLVHSALHQCTHQQMCSAMQTGQIVAIKKIHLGKAKEVRHASSCPMGPPWECLTCANRRPCFGMHLSTAYI